jgi:predicted secreted protein
MLQGQTLNNQQFQLTCSPAGLTSLKHVQDVFDTDYILPGRSIGDLVLRYRTVASTDWKRVSQAAVNAAGCAGSRVSLRVGNAVPTIATESRISSSVVPTAAGRRGFPTNALNDQLEPTNSRDSVTPLFTWPGSHGTRERVQYDFQATQTVSSVEVYWAERPTVKLPASWTVEYRDGEQWKEVESSGSYGVGADQFNHISFAPVTTSALRLTVQLASDATAGIYEWRVNTSMGKQVVDDPQIAPSETFELDGDALVWSITVRNTSDQRLEVGDLGIPLPFNTQYNADKFDTYTKRLIRHAFIGGGGSYIFWQRTNGIGPFLVMVPQKGSGFEYFDQQSAGGGGGRGVFAAYIHSAAAGQDVVGRGGKWRLPFTKVVLAPKGQPGDARTYTYRFRWAKDYDAVRDVLYQEGGFDVTIVPGMTIPTDLTARFAVRTRNTIAKVEPEFPGVTVIADLPSKAKDTHIYEVKFSKLGENLLKVNYGDGEYLSLEFFVTEPIENLYKKRAHFLTTTDQWKDPSRWYDTLYSQWDMKNQILRSPDDRDGGSLNPYMVACDDTELGKPAYIAGKNIVYPDQGEIDSVEAHIRKYVWGGLQQTEQEPYPYGIYGIPNWKELRASLNDDRTGKKHLWRIYDYPHVILMYYNMYLVARNYPQMVHYLDKAGYLQRAYGTAMALYTYPEQLDHWEPYSTGTYNELVIPELIRALEENGKRDQADKLRAKWELKAKTFINEKPNLWGSEYAFDSTGFESTEALAKYSMERLQNPNATEFRAQVKPEDAEAFLEEQMRLNLSCRGQEPAYYYLGSDFRGNAGAGFTLSYMAQMGGWAVEDYALNFAKNPTPYLRLGYASYLSSWALLNSGTAESNYGYWYPGKANDGGASGGFEPAALGRAWLGNKLVHGAWWYDGEIDLGFSGALRSAATVVGDDPLFGLIAYGGSLKRSGASVEVVPKDGLRTRFYIVRGTARVELTLDRDGFAKDQPVIFDDSLKQIDFQLENRGGGAHEAVLHLRGLPVGGYRVSVNGAMLPGESLDVKVPVAAAGMTRVTVRQKHRSLTLAVR